MGKLSRLRAAERQENFQRGLFGKITRLVTGRPKTVAISMVLLMLVAGGIGGRVTKNLTSGGFEDPKSESAQAAERINKEFGRTNTNILLLVTFNSGTVNDPANVAEAAKLEQKLRGSENVSGVISYWTGGNAPALKGKDSKQALILGSLAGSEDQVAERIKKLAPEFTISNDAVQVGVGGEAEIGHQFNKQIEDDLKVAETIALPITLFLLVLVFRSVIAASLPIIIGVFAIMGSLFVLFVMTKFTNVSVYALNLTTMLGLGLAIDYSLFIVSRFREHMARGESVDEAIGHTIQKAGKTVMFSALTVAVSLAALLVFPQTFLKSFAFAGVAVSLVAALGSILLLPAVLKLLGKNVNKWHLGKAANYEKGSKLWHSIAVFVMKRPARVAILAIALLLFLGTPFLSINLGRGDERSLPITNPVRVVHDEIRANFTSRQSAGLEIVSTSASGVTPTAIATYATELSKLPGADHVEASTGVYAAGQKVSEPVAANQFVANKGTWLAVIPNIEPFSEEGEKLTNGVRNTDAPFRVQVGGASASLVDLKQSIYKKLPTALAVIAVATFVLLFMMFGSILVPIKALVINVLSLSAVFGIVTYIFQQGHLSGQFGFTATGAIEATMPILMFCVAFGLSMDYEVFLLSRIREHYLKTGNNRESVANGLEKTGGIVTAAALSISVVFLAFAASGVTTIKLFGVGLAVAVLLDAFIIRGTLVPAFMRLAGRANWWAPKPLRKFHDRFGISE